MIERRENPDILVRKTDFQHKPTNITFVKQIKKKEMPVSTVLSQYEFLPACLESSGKEKTLICIFTRVYAVSKLV